MVANAGFLQTNRRMIYSLALASGIHLVVIFGLAFGFELPAQSRKATAVTFALSPATTAPTDATHIAAADQQGELEELTVSARFAGASLAILETGEDRAIKESAAPDTPTSSSGDVAASQANEAYSARVGAVAARRALDADYLLRWRRRVEQVGNALYRRVTARHGSGDVRLLVVVNANGQLEQARVVRSSGKPALDEAAVATVQRAAPFPSFPPALRAQTERLEIIRTWQFRHGDLD